MKRAKVFGRAVIPAVLASLVAAATAASQDEAPRARPPIAGQEDVPGNRPPASAQDDAPPIRLPMAQGDAQRARLLAEDADGYGQLDRFLEETRTLRADFTQELLDGDGNLVEAAAGTLSLKRPNRFLWSYSEPFEQQVVADAENLWIHDVELEQVTVSPLEGAIASSPAMLLGGDAQGRDGFEVVDAFADGAVAWISLAPREPGGDFQSVRLGFDAGELFALVLVDALGQVTSIEFQNMVVNLEIEDEFFRFAPPAGADLIGEPVDNAR